MQPKAVALSKQMDQMNALRAVWLGLLAMAFVVVQAVMAQARPDSLAPLAEQISPSVVNIYTAKLVTQRRAPVFTDPLLQYFFGTFRHAEQTPTP